MVQVDLITGFLGSGKTTFLRRYARYLLDQGHNLCILENDFGAVNVDLMLLQDLMGDRCDVETISGGCDCDTHQRRLRTKLISLAMRGFDRVLVEPSGIFDVDEFFDVLREEPLDQWYQLGNVLSIVDAGLEPELSAPSEALLAGQVAGAGLVILSRCQLTPPEEIQATIAHLNRTMEHCHCSRRFGADVLCKPWDQLTDEDFARISQAGSVQSSYEKLHFDDHEAFTSLYFLNEILPLPRLKALATRLLNSPDCGNVLRVKGFMPDGDGWAELNATRRELTLRPIPKGQAVVIVIGEHLNKESIRALWQTFQKEHPSESDN